MPAELVPLASVMALVLAWPRLRRPTSNTRLVLEVLLIVLVTIAALAAVWATYWWIEQRW